MFTQKTTQNVDYAAISVQSIGFLLKIWDDSYWLLIGMSHIATVYRNISVKSISSHQHIPKVCRFNLPHC